MFEECSKYGNIVHLSVDQISPNGSISIKFSNSNSAANAINGLNGKYYDGYINILNYLSSFAYYFV